jgi:pimeloyl-[acyl-carrier protein] methyl ester esterase
MMPLVMLHGWGMSRHVFHDLVEALPARYDVSCMDLPGYDQRAPSDPYTLEQLARDVAWDAPPRCVVVGWSLGAQIALAWAHDQPDQIAALVLIAATPCFMQSDDWRAGIRRSVLEEFAAGLRRDYRATLSRFVSLQASGEPDPKRTMHRLRDSAAQKLLPGPETLEHGLTVLMESDLRPLLPDVSARTLLVHGERDQLVPLAAAEYLGRPLSAARRAVGPEAALAPFVSRPDVVRDLMVEFCDA